MWYKQFIHTAEADMHVKNPKENAPGQVRSVYSLYALEVFTPGKPQLANHNVNEKPARVVYAPGKVIATTLFQNTLSTHE